MAWEWSCPCLGDSAVFEMGLLALGIDADVECRAIGVDLASFDAAAFVASLVFLALRRGLAGGGGNALSLDAILKARTFACSDALGALLRRGGVGGGFFVVDGGGAVPQRMKQKQRKQEKRKSELSHGAILWSCRSEGFVKNATAYNRIDEKGEGRRFSGVGAPLVEMVFFVG